MLLCRERGFFNLDEIQCAIFEHNGKLSILPKGIYKPITPNDMSIQVNESHIGVEIIMDGRIMGENLLRIGRNEGWLNKQLKNNGYANASSVFLGIYREDDDTMQLYPMN